MRSYTQGRTYQGYNVTVAVIEEWDKAVSQHAVSQSCWVLDGFLHERTVACSANDTMMTRVGSRRLGVLVKPVTEMSVDVTHRPE